MTKEELKQRLIDLIKEKCPFGIYTPNCMSRFEEADYTPLADHLIANGVTIRERGEWIAKPQDWYIGDTAWMCSNCKEEFCPTDMTSEEFLQMMKFCLNCGADMRGDAK